MSLAIIIYHTLNIAVSNLYTLKCKKIKTKESVKPKDYQINNYKGAKDEAGLCIF